MKAAAVPPARWERVEGLKGIVTAMTPDAAAYAPNTRLTTEEEAVLAGSEGPVLQKVMRTVVQYGEALAPRGSSISPATGTW